MIIVAQTAALLSYTTDPEILLERAGRTCYKSEDRITPESAPKFVDMICQKNHESVLEHAVATLVFTTDRGITHEFVRHRLCSFSQESTRYVNYYKKGEIRVVKPLLFKTMASAESWVRAMLHAESEYNFQIAQGEAPEVARDSLPTCTAADIVVTANFRQWKHIIKLRTAKAAHPKIRMLIGMARDLLVGISPTVFKVSV